MNRLDNVEKTQLRENIPAFQSGDTVKVHVRIQEGNKERLQIFEGVVIARKHGTGPETGVLFEHLAVSAHGLQAGTEEVRMAKYGKAASKTVKSAMRRKKKGTLKSGSGRKVTSRKQAIAIGLSEAREKGAKVPARRSAATKSRKTSGRRAAKKR